mgnify:CR=1 FL=1
MRFRREIGGMLLRIIVKLSINLGSRIFVRRKRLRVKQQSKFNQRTELKMFKMLSA